jgi:hypothetical protein
MSTLRELNLYTEPRTSLRRTRKEQTITGFWSDGLETRDTTIAAADAPELVALADRIEAAVAQGLASAKSTTKPQWCAVDVNVARNEIRIRKATSGPDGTVKMMPLDPASDAAARAAVAAIL